MSVYLKCFYLKTEKTEMHFRHLKLFYFQKGKKIAVLGGKKKIGAVYGYGAVAVHK